MGRKHEMDLDCQHVYYYGRVNMTNEYDESMIQKACELLCLLVTDTQCHWFYQLFWGWYSPRTNKLKYDLNLERAWYNLMGEKIGWGFTISDF
jgi:hypothetical protein